VLWLFREMPRIKPKYVLDVGCESGFITRWMVDGPTQTIGGTE
jgi:2-polyprenyl-3-methyl-5-hydroxy-6-metoxy-1,4-benzoquinol methylase